MFAKQNVVTHLNSLKSIFHIKTTNFLIFVPKRTANIIEDIMKFYSASNNDMLSIHY